MLESGEDFLCTTDPSQIARCEGNLQLSQSPYQCPYAGSGFYHFLSVASIVATQHTRNLLNTDNVWCLTQLPMPVPSYIFTNVEGKCNMVNKVTFKRVPAALAGPAKAMGAAGNEKP